jgi:hypothetical protein
MAGPPSITDWISAVSTATLGVLGAFITAWQWRKTGFRARLKAKVDEPREAIVLTIINTGRSGGVIDEILLVRPNGDVEDAEYEGFRNNVFQSLTLPVLASMQIVVQAPPKRTFSDDVRLHVRMGGEEKSKVLAPTVLPRGMGLYGLHSVLPPGTPNG